MRFELDTIYERREDARAKMEHYKTKTKMAYDKKVNQRSFPEGDLVLRQADALKATGKLDAN